MTIDLDNLTPATRYVVERAAQMLTERVVAEITSAAVAVALIEDSTP
ncbi:MAG: hypothetical protein PGN15_09800 [Aeromicrobium erythreum]